MTTDDYRKFLEHHMTVTESKLNALTLAIDAIGSGMVVLAKVDPRDPAIDKYMKDTGENLRTIADLLSKHAMSKPCHYCGEC